MNRASARDIAFVFQLFALYPHMNVQQHQFSPECEAISTTETERRVVEAARILHISICSTSRYRPCRRQPATRRTRSGHRARETAKCFLMDEPLGALDTEMREAIIRELRALHDRLRCDGLRHALTSSKPWQWPTPSP